MTVSENFVNLVPSLLDNGCGSTDSAKIRRIFEISPADFESIKSPKPRISIYETIDLLYCTVFGTPLLYSNSQVALSRISGCYRAITCVPGAAAPYLK
jgi:hypothetical protein